MGLPDPRTKGSKNPGATNVLRIGGKKIAAFVLLFDGLKGALPVILAHYLGFSLFELTIILLCAFLGHVFPIFYGFKGGKGVATYVGILFSINIILGFVFVVSWGIIFVISKFSSLSSIIASLVIPLYLFIFGNHNSIFFMIMFILILYTHRENVKRLKNKEETKTKIY